MSINDYDEVLFPFFAIIILGITIISCSSIRDTMRPLPTFSLNYRTNLKFVRLPCKICYNTHRISNSRKKCSIRGRTMQSSTIRKIFENGGKMTYGYNMGYGLHLPFCQNFHYACGNMRQEFPVQRPYRVVRI